MNFTKRYSPLLPALLLLPLLAAAQRPAKPNAADLHQAIKKLNVLGSVLYVAAHPDDENQRLISYCANEKLYDVTYLSLTRGDGGQNLIGPEMSELLGVLRTEELLMARSVDGGRQRFTRANDFGFSKNPDETLGFWNKDAVLSDVVWAMRETQPDVVINRFYHDKKYDTHGHHTASAMLSVEAFDLAGKKDVYADQLQYTEPWQPRRVFFNTSWWFFGGREAFEKMDKSHLFTVNGGVYLPLKGKSNNEVAAEARSMHRCQGFGSLTYRGDAQEWFEFIKGDRPTTPDPFAGINTTWTRVPGGEKIGKLLAKVEASYRSDNPAASVPDLVKALQLIEALPDGHWKRVKLADIREVIRGCLGLYLEATAGAAVAAPGDSVRLHLEFTNRAQQPVELVGVSVQPALFDSTFNLTLTPNKEYTHNRRVRLPADAGFTAPYWLQSAHTVGMYNVPEQTRRGLAETPRFARVRWSLRVAGVPVQYETDIAYKTEEPAIGEVWQPFDVLPPATASFGERAYVFAGTGERPVYVTVRAGRDAAVGTLAINVPAGWRVTPASAPFTMKKLGETQVFAFSVTPGSTEKGQLSAVISVDSRQYNQRLVTIDYPHIPRQNVLLDNAVNATGTALVTHAQRVGYYMGAGDDVPAALRQLGVSVTLLEDKDMELATLQGFDAVVLGIRAYNTKENLKFHQAKLADYVRGGGTLVVQYNNSFDLFVEPPSLLPLKLSRTRVTDETAEIRFRQPEHAVLNTPNKLTPADFAGWVQERGLYFPSEWDAAYEAPLSMNDPGEKPADGALLVGKLGRGHVVYTGLSLFRQLPAGVPGAYRLVANLISLGKSGPGGSMK
jgi:LmbE family N-acetylglucosaminyl deacetylase